MKQVTGINYRPYMFYYMAKDMAKESPSLLRFFVESRGVLVEFKKRRNDNGVTKWDSITHDTMEDAPVQTRVNELISACDFTWNYDHRLIEAKRECKSPKFPLPWPAEVHAPVGNKGLVAVMRTVNEIGKEVEAGVVMGGAGYLLPDLLRIVAQYISPSKKIEDWISPSIPYLFEPEESSDSGSEQEEEVDDEEQEEEQQTITIRRVDKAQEAEEHVDGLCCDSSCGLCHVLQQM